MSPGTDPSMFPALARIETYTVRQAAAPAVTGFGPAGVSAHLDPHAPSPAAFPALALVNLVVVQVTARLAPEPAVPMPDTAPPALARPEGDVQGRPEPPAGTQAPRYFAVTSTRRRA